MRLISIILSFVLTQTLFSQPNWGWAEMMTGANTNEKVLKVIADTNNNYFYATGYITSTTPFLTDIEAADLIGGKDCFLAKFDAQGNYIWSVNMGTSFNDSCIAITIDASGNVFAGISVLGPPTISHKGGTSTFTDYGNTTPDTWVFKFDEDGVYDAGFVFQTSEPVTAKAITGVGNSVYLVGEYSIGGVNLASTTLSYYSTGSPATDAYVIRLNSSNLNPMWVQNIQSPGTEYIQDIASDGSRVYLTGVSNGLALSGDNGGTIATNVNPDGEFKVFTARLRHNNGNIDWLKYEDVTSPNHSFYNNSIALSDNDFYLATKVKGDGILSGSAGSYSTGNTNFSTLISKHSKNNGNSENFQILGASSADVLSGDISLDGIGNVYSIGAFTNSFALQSVTLGNDSKSNYDYYVLKFDPALNLLWSEESTGGSGNAGHDVLGVGFEPIGNGDYVIAASTGRESVAFGSKTAGDAFSSDKSSAVFAGTRFTGLKANDDYLCAKDSNDRYVVNFDVLFNDDLAFTQESNINVLMINSQSKYADVYPQGGLFSAVVYQWKEENHPLPIFAIDTFKYVLVNSSDGYPNDTGNVFISFSENCEIGWTTNPGLDPLYDTLTTCLLANGSTNIIEIPSRGSDEVDEVTITQAPLSSTVESIDDEEILINSTNVGLRDTLYIRAGYKSGIVVNYALILELSNVANAGKDSLHEVCENEINLYANEAAFGVGVWQIINGTANIDNLNDPKSPIEILSEEIELSWEIQNNNGCEDNNDVVKITLNGDPTETFAFICPGDTVIEQQGCDFELVDFIPTLEINLPCDDINSLSQSPSSTTVITESTTLTFDLLTDNGVTATCSFDLFVEDTSAPVISCPTTVDLYLDDNCEVLMPDFTDSVEVTVACAGGYLFNQSISANTITTINTNVDILVTGSNNKTTTCKIEVLVLDTIAPELTCLSDQTLCEHELANLDWQPTALDNCTSPTLISQLAGPTTESEFTVGTNQLSYSTADEAGNEATCTFNITMLASLEASWDGLPVRACVSADFIALDELVTGDPGGDWSGTGINGLNEFVAGDAGIGTHNIVYTVDNGSCQNSEARTIEIVQDSVYDFGNLETVCNDQTQLNLSSTSANIGSWSYDVSKIALDDNTKLDAQVTALEEGEYMLVWAEQHNGLCGGSGQVELTFVFPPEQPYAGEDTILMNDTYQLNATPSAKGLASWVVLSGDAHINDPSDPQTTVSGLTPGQNVFEWRVSLDGCPDLTDQVRVFKESNITMMKIPSGFSPNDDGINDFFEIENIKPGGSLIVYDRWGNTVYENSSYENGWEGNHQNGKELPEDTYFYVFTLPGERYEGYLVIKR